MRITDLLSIRFYTLFALVVFAACTPEETESPYLTGLGYGINSSTIMVKDIESSIAYYRDSLGFSIRGGAEEGEYGGSVSAAIYMPDMSQLELMSLNDSLSEDLKPQFIRDYLTSHEGARMYSLSSSSADSTFMSLTSRGFTLDSAREFRSSEVSEGWSWDNGGPERRSLDFDASNPPAYLPRFVERADFDYNRLNRQWRTNYAYNRRYGTHPNGVVGISAIRVAVTDFEAAQESFKSMGLAVVEASDSIARFQISENQELQLTSVNSGTNVQDFLQQNGEGVYAIEFEVENLDSTYQYLQEELPAEALTKTSDRLVISQEFAYGVQLEFVQEPEEQGLMARRLRPDDKLDSAGIKHAALLYQKYCALCHGDNREGYAADNAPSLKSESLLASSKDNNFMRYTIQYGRANTAMGGYRDTQGGPMEYIDIEILLQWLYETSGVEEPIELSREPVLGDIALGEEIYGAKCATCHGENGEGISAPALGNPMLLATATDHFLRYAVAEGRDGTPMVAFKDSLNEAEIDAVTAFLRTRASGWDIPQLDSVKVPSPEEYVLNPDNSAPNFTLREGRFVSSEQVNQALQDSMRMIILDARSEVAWRQMHIPGSAPVPYYMEPDEFIHDIPNDGTQIVIYCACPHAASMRVMNTLKRHGYENVVIIDEGILVWAQMGFPVRNGS